ncbi:MAG TPA: dihydropteroate synthase [Gemmatimonadales bacterium]
MTAGAASWRLRDRVVALDRPIVVGILNVTPDSFSDGGRFVSVGDAVAHASRLVAEGADAIDVGGESTRPQGAVRVDADEEIRRVLPVVGRLRAAHPSLVLSVDTTKRDVAAAALDAGADAVNDVSGFRLDAGMASMCAEARCGVVLMHSRGGVSEMGTYAHASYGDDAVGEMLDELRRRVLAAREAGIDPGRIVVDPGIGFAKRSEHSLAALARLPELASWGHPVMVGVSRKRFIGEITGVTNAAERVHGTVGANVAALLLGARLFRVHDVAASRRALDVAWAVMRAGGPT